jgi:dihydroorotate dehydrogenase (fumarate)
MSVDLTTNYLGLKLKNPMVVAACPLTGQMDILQRLDEANAAAVVLPSLFEEQIAHDELAMAEVHEFGTDSFAESLSFFPEQDDYRTGPQEYLRTLEDAKKALSVPVIGSLNGTSEGGWVRYAKLMEEAGADALELNIYLIAADVESTAEQVEQRYLDLIKTVKSAISIPMAVKVGPYFSSMGHMAIRMAKAGADGLVLFNRFLQPDIHLDDMTTKPKLVLSTDFEMLLPLRWIAILKGRIEASLALTSGLNSSQGLIKAVLAGADVAQVASMLYKDGVHRVQAILDEMAEWMEEQEYESVEQMKGSMSHENSPDPSAFERGNYMKALQAYAGEPI